MLEEKDSTIETNVPRNALWLVWLLWVLVYVLGYGTGGYIGATAAGQVLKLFPEGQRGLDNTWAVLASGLVWALVLGVILSGFQALLLHYHIRGFNWRRWVIASVLGLMGATALVGGLQAFIVDQASNALYYTLYLSVLVGIAAGVWGWAQHLVLSDYLPDENAWIVSTCLASAVGTLLAMLWFMSLRGSGFLDVDFFLLGGAIFLAVGAATGLALVGLLSRAHRDAH